MTLEEYLRRELARGAIDFRIRASADDGTVRFYIHPQGRDGDTRDWVVNGNAVSRDPRISRADDE